MVCPRLAFELDYQVDDCFDPVKDGVPKVLEGMKPPEAMEAIQATRGPRSIILHLTLQELSQFRNSLRPFDDDSDPNQEVSLTRLTDQDLLTAWYISLLIRTDHPIRSILYVVDHRLLTHAPDLAVSGIQLRQITLPSYHSHTDGNAELPSTLSYNDPKNLMRLILLVGGTIRSDLLSLRNDPSKTNRWLSGCAHEMYHTAIHRTQWVPAMAKDTVLINSYLKYDWTGLSFGFHKEDVGYYNAFAPLARILHVSKRNYEQGIHLDFALEDEREMKAVEELIRRDRERWELGRDDKA